MSRLIREIYLVFIVYLLLSVFYGVIKIQDTLLVKYVMGANVVKDFFCLA